MGEYLINKNIKDFKASYSTTYDSFLLNGTQYPVLHEYVVETNEGDWFVLVDEFDVIVDSYEDIESY